jgi:hypothetical protein
VTVLVGVMNRVYIITVRHLGVVSCLFVIAAFVVLGSRAMMFSRLIMVICSFTMMFRAFF